MIEEKDVIDTEGGVTSYEYDCAGSIISRTDPGGAMTVYQYDANYQMIKELVTTTYTYDIYGNVVTATDEAGNATTYSYDGNGCGKRRQHHYLL